MCIYIQYIHAHACAHTKISFDRPRVSIKEPVPSWPLRFYYALGSHVSVRSAFESASGIIHYSCKAALGFEVR